MPHLILICDCTDHQLLLGLLLLCKFHAIWKFTQSADFGTKIEGHMLYAFWSTLSFYLQNFIIVCMQTELSYRCTKGYEIYIKWSLLYCEIHCTIYYLQTHLNSEDLHVADCTNSLNTWNIHVAINSIFMHNLNNI